MSELKKISINEVPQDILDKVKNLKKSDKIVSELADDDLDGVAGGFKMKEGYAKGRKISCPNCREGSIDDISTWEDPDDKCSMFYCLTCRTTWGIYPDGYIREM